MGVSTASSPARLLQACKQPSPPSHLRAPHHAGFSDLIRSALHMHARTHARPSVSPSQFPSALMKYIWHLENAPQQRATIYLPNISRPAAADGIFMKGTWQPVFSAVFMGNTAKCSRCLPTLSTGSHLAWSSAGPFSHHQLVSDEARKEFWNLRRLNLW